MYFIYNLFGTFFFSIFVDKCKQLENQIKLLKSESYSLKEEINELVTKALKCLDDYETYTQEQIDYIVAKASVAALDAHGSLAKIAIEETKILKVWLHWCLTK